LAKDSKKKKGGLLQRLRSSKQPKTDPELTALLDEVQLDPNNMRTRRKLADYYLKKGDTVRALDQYLTVAETYADKGFYPKSVAVYKQALQIDPNMIEVYLKLANLYHKLGLMPEVVEQYQKAAAIYEQQGKEREALDIRRMLLDLDATNVVGRIKLGQRYLEKGFTQEAVNEFMRAADIFEQQEKTAELQKLLEGILDRGIESFDVLYRLVEVYREQNRPDLALTRLAKLTGELAGSVSTLELTAELAEELGKPVVAVKALERAGKLYEEINRGDKVVEVCQRILAIDDANEYAQQTMQATAAEAEAAPVEDEAVTPVEEEVVPEPEIESEAAPEIEEPELEAVEEPDEILIEEEPEADEISIEEEVTLDEVEAEPEIEEVMIEEEPELAVEPEIEEIPVEEIPEEEPAIEEIPLEEEPELAAEPEIEEIPVEEITEEEPAIEEIQLEEELELTAEPEIEEIPVEEIIEEEPVVEEIPAEEIVEEEPEIEELLPDEELELAAESEIEEISVEETIEAEPSIDEADVMAEVEAVEPEPEAVEELPAEPEIDEEIPLEEISDEAAAEAEAAMIEEVESAEPTEEIDEIDKVAFEGVEAEAEEEEEGPEQLDLAAMSEEEATQRLDEAIDIYLKYNLRDKAIEYLNLALERNPDSLPILEKIMVVYRDGGEEEQANELLDQLIDLAQQEGRTDKLEHYLSLMVEYSPEDMAAAKRLAEHYVDSEPERAVVHFFELANRHRELDQFEEAEKLLEQVLEIDPANEGAHQELLAIHEQTNQVDKAISELYFLFKLASDSGDVPGAEAYLKRVLELRPMEQQAHDALIELYETTGESEKLTDLLRRLADRMQGADELALAKHYYERLLTLDPTNVGNYEKLKDLLLEIQQPEDAIAQLFTIARLAVDQDSPQKAVEALRELLTLAPDNIVARERLRDIYIETGDRDHAINEIMSLAKAAMDDQDAESALTHINRILELDPRHEQSRRRKISILRDLDREDDAIETLFAMSRDLELTGEMDKAETCLREVMEIQPDSLRAREALKDLFLTAGMSDKAIGELVGLAQTAQSKGDNKTALTYWGEICGLEPENVEARQGIADLHLADGNITDAVAEMLAIADIQSRGGKAEAAIDTLRKAHKQDVGNEVVVDRLVQQYFAANQNGHAVALLDEAGERAAEAGRMDLALEYYGKIVEVDAENINAREKFKTALIDIGDNAKAIEQMYALADLYNMFGEASRVEESYKQILSLDAEQQRASIALKDHYLAVGRQDAALEMLHDFVVRSRQAGELDQAQAFANEMLETAPDDRRALLALAEIAVIVGEPEAAIERYLSLAVLAEQDERADDAEGLYQKVLEINADNVEAHQHLKELLLSRDEIPGAITHLFALADLAVQDNDTNRAESLYREVLTVDEDNEPALEQLVNLFVAAGEGERAIPEMFQLADASQKKDDYARAEKFLQQILDLDPDNEKAIESLSQVHIAAGDTGQAISELFTLEAAADAKGDYTAALALVDRILGLDDQNLSALSKKADLQEVLEQEEEAIATLLQLADVQNQRELLEDGERTLRRVIKLQPQNETAHGQLVDLLTRTEAPRAVIDELLRFHHEAIEAGDADVVKQVAERILGIDPKFERAHRMLVDLYREQGDDEQAVAQLFEMADLAAEAERTADCEALYKEVLGLSKTNALATERLTTIYTDTDRNDEAVRLLLEFGDALAGAEQTAEARNAYEQVLTLSEGNEDALRKLKDSYLAADELAEAEQVLMRTVDAFDERDEKAKAVAALEEILDINPRHESALDDLKGRYLEAGDNAKAVDLLFAAEQNMGDTWDDQRRIENMEEALSIDADNEQALERLVELHKANDQVELAIDALLRLAKKHGEKEDSDAVEKDLRAVLTLDAARVDAHERLIELYRGADDNEAMVAELFELANIKRHAGDLDGAQSCLMDVVDSGLHKTRALGELAEIYQERGDEDKRLEMQFKLADTARESGDDAEAESIYREILAEDETNITAREALIDLFAQAERTTDAAEQALVLADRARMNGENEQAIDRYQQVLLFTPENTRSRRRLKKLLFDAERIDEAVDQLRALADIASEKEEYEDVEDALREILQHRPDDREIRNELIELYSKTEQPDKAVIELLEMARLTQDAGDADQALELTERAVELQPDNAAALLNLKEAYVEGGKTEQAVDILFRLYEVDVKAKKRHSAEKCLREILVLQPDNAVAKEKVFDLFKIGAGVEEQIAELLAEAEQAQTAGDRESAEAALNQVLELDPEQSEARMRLQGLYAEGKPAAPVAPPPEAKPAVEPELGVTEAEGRVFEEVDVTAQSDSDIEEEISIDWGEPEQLDEIAEASSEVEAAVEEDVFGIPEEEEVEDIDVFGEVSDTPTAEPVVEEPEAAEPVAAEPMQEEATLFESVEVSSEDFIESGDVPRPEPPIQEKPEESRILEDFRTPEPEAEAEVVEAEPVQEEEISAEVMEAMDELIEPEAPVEAEPAEEKLGVADLLGDLGLEEGESKAEAAATAGGDLLDDIFGEKPAAPAEPSGDALDDLIGELGQETKAVDTQTDDIFQSFVDSLGEQKPGGDNAQAHYELGIAFREMDSLEEAIAEFEKALAKDVGEMAFEINYELGQCYASMDKLEMAVEYLESALSEGSDDDQALLDLNFELGVCLKKLGKLAEAKNYFIEVDNQSSNYRGAKDEIAECDKMRGGKKGKKKKKGGDDDNIGFL